MCMRGRMPRLASLAEERSPTPAAPQRFLVFLVLLAAVLLAFVVRPLVTPLILAAALATVLWRPQRWLTRRFGGRRSAAATVMVVGIVLVTLAPLAWIATTGISEIRSGVELLHTTLREPSTDTWVADLPGPLRGIAAKTITSLKELTTAVAPNEVANPVSGATPRIAPDAAANGGALADAARGALAATWSFAFGTAMFLIAWYCLLVQGDRLVEWLVAASPLHPEQTDELLREFRDTASSLAIATLVTNTVQTVAATAGYLVLGVPKPLFFAVLTFVAASIPAFGASGVSLLAALLLLLDGRQGAALALAIWSVTVVALIDNVTKPLLMGSDTGMPGALVFFSLVGGLAAFGAIGLIVGPLALAAFLALVRIQRRTDGAVA